MKLEAIFFCQMAALIGTVVGVLFAAAGILLVLLASTAAFDRGFWVDTSSWALPVALTWDGGHWMDGRPFWQATIQVLCFYWRAGSA